MLDLISRRVHFHSHYIESIWGRSAPRLPAVLPRRGDYVSLLIVIYRGFRCPRSAGLPSLDFNKNQRIAIPADQVDLAPLPLRAIVPADHDKASLTQVPVNSLFSFAPRARRGCQILPFERGARSPLNHFLPDSPHRSPSLDNLNEMEVTFAIVEVIQS